MLYSTNPKILNEIHWKVERKNNVKGVKQKNYRGAGTLRKALVQMDRAAAFWSGVVM